MIRIHNLPSLLRPLSTPLLLLLAISGPMSAQGPVAGSNPQEQAQFLAGIPLPPRSPLARLQKSPEYRSHRDALREQWDFCRQIRYGAMQRWAADHLARYPSTRGVLRYLFGGPDFLNAYAFFPDTRVMVLGGLEPVGEVPPPEALTPAALGPALKALDEALHTSLFTGYFITSEMKPQLAQGAFRGVLPVLYTELALTGNIIDSVSAERPFGSSGVRITYHRAGGPAQTLWYFQADLSNGKECRRFLSWLGELGPGASYLKAASYLLPLNSFSETRSFLTGTSELILQDDSGLPYRAFEPGMWRLSLYGAYTDPLPIFKLRRDPALTEAYATPQRAESLPFGVGYHVRPAEANLLLAVRASELPGSSPDAPTAPPALPAFATPSPTPRPAKVRIRKALPVPIRRAIPMAAPIPAPTENPVPAPPPAVIPQPVAVPRPAPAVSAETGDVRLSGSSATPSAVVPVVSVPAEQPSDPAQSTGHPVQVAVPLEEVTATPSPMKQKPSLARDGKPID